MLEKKIRVLEAYAAIATIIATCVAVIALIPSFGQWLNPHIPISQVVLPTTTQQKRYIPTETPLPRATSTIPPPEIKILMTRRCDPRISYDKCGIGDHFNYFNEFFGVIDALNATLVYKEPFSLQDLTPYTVVITDFCSNTANEKSLNAIKEYINSGGSVFFTGSSFCSAGDYHTSWYASQVTKEFGVTYTDDDDDVNIWGSEFNLHPITNGIDSIFLYRHAYLNVARPAQTIAKINGKPVMAVYDGDGTFVALAMEYFDWGANFKNEISSSDNFALWSNILEWLILQSQLKR